MTPAPDRGPGGLTWPSRFSRIPRLTLLGAGFVGDQEAQDGVHLRWSFDPDLGFPAEGFLLWSRRRAPHEHPQGLVRPAGQQLEQQPRPPASSGVTVHRADGGRLQAGRRCDQIGLDWARAAGPAVPDGVRHAAGAGASVTVFGLAQRGAVSVRARHAGRVADCAASAGPPAWPAPRDAVATRSRAGRRRDDAGRRDLRVRRRRGDVAQAPRRPGEARGACATSGSPAAATCTPFELTVGADAIDEVLVSGCDAILVGVVWSPIDADDAERGWTLLAGPICLPVDEALTYLCSSGPGSGRSIAKSRLPRSRRPPQRRADPRAAWTPACSGRTSTSCTLRSRRCSAAAVSSSSASTPMTPTTARPGGYDVVRDALTAAVDPYFARILGLYVVHRPSDPTGRFDYRIEATWPIDGEKQRLVAGSSTTAASRRSRRCRHRPRSQPPPGSAPRTSWPTAS